MNKKIIEKIVCARPTDFLDVNNLISISQYGFRKKHYTLHPLIHFQNFVPLLLTKKNTQLLYSVISGKLRHRGSQNFINLPVTKKNGSARSRVALVPGLPH